MYLRVLSDKIHEKWDGKALPGLQPIVLFEIWRDGRVNLDTIKVETSSGNPVYDRIAMRAIVEALPFPPLPEDIKVCYLRIHLRFDYRR